MPSPLAAWIGLLAELSRTDPDPRVRRRAQCLVVLDGSASPGQTARLVGVDTKTLRRWRQRFLAQGREGLLDRPRPGRPRKLDGEAETFMERVLSELPTVHGYATATWTLADLQDRLARHGWVVSLGTVERTLHRLGYQYRRPRHDLDHRRDADVVATAQQTLAVLQKKGLITPAESASCISTSVICTPIPTWQKSGNRAGPPPPSQPPGLISGSPSSGPSSTAPER
jgi:transposase